MNRVTMINKLTEITQRIHKAPPDVISERLNEVINALQSKNDLVDSEYGQGKVEYILSLRQNPDILKDFEARIPDPEVCCPPLKKDYKKIQGDVKRVEALLKSDSNTFLVDVMHGEYQDPNNVIEGVIVVAIGMRDGWPTEMRHLQFKLLDGTEIIYSFNNEGCPEDEIDYLEMGPQQRHVLRIKERT